MLFSNDNDTFYGILFEWLGQIFSILYFLTPYFQMIQVYRGKLELETIPLILILSILPNCILWVALGMLNVFSNLHPWLSMIICNSLGFVANMILFILYLKKYFGERIMPFFGFLIFVTIILAIGFSLFYALYKSDERGKVYPKIFPTIMNVIMYISPSTNIYKVLKTGKTEYLPILNLGIGFFTCYIWILYGVATHERDTIISNSINIVVVGIQICFWVYFFAKKIKLERPRKIQDKSEAFIETGQLTYKLSK